MKPKNKYSHAELVRLLAEMVHGRKAGERLNNDRELATRFGVSNVTIRAAMMELVRDGLVVRRDRSGTYVADISQRQHVAIVVSQEILRSQRMPFHNRATMSIMSELNRIDQAYKLYMIPISGEDLVGVEWPHQDQVEQSGLTASIERNEIRGLVCVGIGNSNGWIDQLRLRDAPVVALSGDPTNRHRFRFRIDDYIRYAVRYLANFGRKKIAYLGWWQPQRRNEGHADPSLSAFRDELTKCGLSFHEEWVNNLVNPNIASAGWLAFRDLWISRPDEKPDALICMDDLIFASASSAMLAAGIRVPRELQIVTHWNKGSGLLCPYPVARFEYDAGQVGPLVCELLAECLENPKLEPQVRLLRAEWFTEGQFPEVHENLYEGLIDFGPGMELP